MTDKKIPLIAKNKIIGKWVFSCKNKFKRNWKTANHNLGVNKDQMSLCSVTPILGLYLRIKKRAINFYFIWSINCQINPCDNLPDFHWQNWLKRGRTPHSRLRCFFEMIRKVESSLTNQPKLRHCSSWFFLSIQATGWIPTFFAIREYLRVKITSIVLIFHQLKINLSDNKTNLKGKFLICDHFRSVSMPLVRTFDP